MKITTGVFNPIYIIKLAERVSNIMVATRKSNINPLALAAGSLTTEPDSFPQQASKTEQVIFIHYCTLLVHTVACTCTCNCITKTTCAVDTFSPSIWSLDAPWTLSNENRSLKCPIHCTSTPELLWMTLYRASRAISTCLSLLACWLCLLVSTSLAVICIRE